MPHIQNGRQGNAVIEITQRFRQGVTGVIHLGRVENEGHGARRERPGGGGGGVAVEAAGGGEVAEIGSEKGNGRGVVVVMVNGGEVNEFPPMGSGWPCGEAELREEGDAAERQGQCPPVLLGERKGWTRSWF